MTEEQFQKLMAIMKDTNAILEEIVADLKEINRLTK
jgi:hypothetical protein